jgi:dCMP deaminase
VLLELKKRNYLNIVLVDASFQQRLKNFLKHTSREENMESVRELMALDEPYHKQEWQDCLEFVRARVLNRGGKAELREELKKREKEVIRYFRPTWDQYFMKIADIARRRSNCMKTSVGAVIVNDENRVISTGYNGTPKEIPSCYRMGC